LKIIQNVGYHLLNEAVSEHSRIKSSKFEILSISASRSSPSFHMMLFKLGKDVKGLISL